MGVGQEEGLKRGAGQQRLDGGGERRAAIHLDLHHLGARLGGRPLEGLGQANAVSVVRP